VHAARHFFLERPMFSMCGNDKFMSTAPAGGKDVFYAQCKERPAAVSIRGWAAYWKWMTACI
jgi:hypothetical protein